MENPKVSILIPCCNSEAFLQETLQSCVNQSYSNIEVILVDDGSTDNSLQIAKNWQKNYSNIFVYSQPNAGVCRARNLAFEKSTGDYIMYLDADDIISPDKISAQIELLRGKANDVICTCAWDRFYSSTEEAQFPHLSVYHDYDNGVTLIEDLLNGGMFGVSCYLTHRSIIEKAGRWNEELTINTDGEFFFRVLANAGKVQFSNKGALYYRSSEMNSISRRKPTEKKGVSLLLSYTLTENYLKRERMLTPRVRNGLVRAYQSVAYQYCQYNNIVQSAKKQARSVSRKNVESSDGGNLFKLMCKILGFWLMLKLKTILK